MGKNVNVFLREREREKSCAHSFFPIVVIASSQSRFTLSLNVSTVSFSIRDDCLTFSFMSQGTPQRAEGASESVKPLTLQETLVVSQPDAFPTHADFSAQQSPSTSFTLSSRRAIVVTSNLRYVAIVTTYIKRRRNFFPLGER